MTTSSVSDDLTYLLRRAEQEAITAIVVDRTVGGPVHFELSRRYSMMAIRALSGAPSTMSSRADIIGSR